MTASNVQTHEDVYRLPWLSASPPPVGPLVVAVPPLARRVGLLTLMETVAGIVGEVAA